MKTNSLNIFICLFLLCSCERTIDIHQLLKTNSTIKKQIQGTNLILNKKVVVDAKTINLLIQLLNSNDFSVRMNAAQALRHIGTKASLAVPSLISKLSDKNKYVRLASISALGEIRFSPDTVVPALIAQLKNESKEDIWIVIESLGNFGADAKIALPHLIPYLKSTNKNIQRSAKIAIPKITSKSASIMLDIERKKQYLNLLTASKEGEFEVVEFLLNKNVHINPNIPKDNNDLTPLMYAASRDFPKIVEILLKNKANPNLCTKNGLTALMMGSGDGNITIVRLLLNHKANINAKSQNNDTALINACYSGNIEVVKVLLKNGADVNIQRNNSQTALDLTIKKGYTEIIKLLKKAGAKTAKELKNLN
jgi:ankyrin repeat protein